MKKLQAAMRDSSARRAREMRHCYRVGSVFKGCANCGEVEVDEEGKAKFTSGFNVYRSYQPSATKWTWICWDCSAKDLKCWAEDQAGMVLAELGKDAIRGTRDAIKERKYGLRKELLRAAKAHVDLQVEGERDKKIRELQEQLAALKAKLGK
jgi:hypothetical protein